MLCMSDEAAQSTAAADGRTAAVCAARVCMCLVKKVCVWWRWMMVWVEVTMQMV